MSVLIGSAAFLYMMKPLGEGNRATPTPIVVLQSVLVIASMAGYDAVFILCIQLMTYRFRTMNETMQLLKDCKQVGAEQQKEILVDIYKMRLDVLR